MGKKSDKVKKDLGVVQVFARCGRLPLRSAYTEYIGPGIPPRQIPGVALHFDDSGVCTLDPARDAETLAAFREWMADGTDPRIASQGVIEIATNIVPPFPKWDVTNANKIPEMVEALGLDPEHCLKYEMLRDGGPRKSIVSALEKALDEPVAEVVQDEPVL